MLAQGHSPSALVEGIFRLQSRESETPRPASSTNLFFANLHDVSLSGHDCFRHPTARPDAAPRSGLPREARGPTAFGFLQHMFR
jgi:hypothetical protein